MYVTYSRQEIELNRKLYEMMYDASHHLVKMDSVMDWDFVSRQLEVFYLHRIGRPTKDHPQCRRYQFKQVNEDLYACPCGVRIGRIIMNLNRPKAIKFVCDSLHDQKYPSLLKVL